MNKLSHKILFFAFGTALYANDVNQAFSAAAGVKVYKTAATDSKVMDTLKKDEAVYYDDDPEVESLPEAKYRKVITRRLKKGFVLSKNLTTRLDGKDCTARHLTAYGLSKVKSSKTYFLRNQKPIATRKKCDPEENACYTVTEFVHAAGETSKTESANEYLSLEMVLPESSFEDLYARLTVCHLELKANPLPLSAYKFGEPLDSQYAIMELKKDKGEMKSLRYRQYFGDAFEIEIKRKKDGKWRIQIYSYL